MLRASLRTIISGFMPVLRIARMLALRWAGVTLSTFLAPLADRRNRQYGFTAYRVFWIRAA